MLVGSPCSGKRRLGTALEDGVTEAQALSKFVDAIRDLTEVCPGR
jgi:hypothetical protein